MAAAWWWLSLPLPGWLGSGATWFVVLNAVVAAVAVLSRARPPLASPRRGGVTRRTSSALLQRLRSSIFSLPSACFNSSAPFLQPDATAQESEHPEPEQAAPTTAPTPRTSRRALPLPASPAAERAPAEEDEDEDDDPNAISMEEAYALALAARRRPEPEREEEARRTEVDAKAEEFIRGFKEDQRQERLNSIFNYTQMLKQRAHAGGHRQPAAQPDQHQLL